MPRTGTPELEVRVGPTAHQPGIELTEYTFPSIPLDHHNPRGPTISVFAREVVSSTAAPNKSELPWLLYLQGGPGFASPRPMGKRGWIRRAVKDYRVLLLDQRGTGRSTPLTAQTLKPFADHPHDLAQYLMKFRADSIVKDCEWIRHALEARTGKFIKWTVLGQSYGGFVLVSYLSSHPEGLARALFTGGLPPLQPENVDEVYRKLYPRLIQHNLGYYQRYPHDVGRVRDIIRYLDTHIVQLPSSGVLTSRRFRQLGLTLGMSGGADGLHYLIEDAWLKVEPSDEEPQLNDRIKLAVEQAQPFGTNPLYALLHEAIYCQGDMQSNWAAHKVIQEYPEMNISVEDTSSDTPVMFTGEMIYPHMFEDYTALGFLYDAACIIAENKHWPILYNADILARNQVPAAAIIFKKDMYVDCQSSIATGELIHAKLWVTSDYSHSALREDGEAILDRLLSMVDSAGSEK